MGKPVNFDGGYDSTGQGAWASSQENAWVEVDLYKDETIHTIATQGIGRKVDDRKYVESYQIMYQRDGEKEYQYYRDANNNIVSFFGNYAPKDTHFNDFDPPITARKIRLVVLTYNGFAALRWELYKCTVEVT